VKEKRNADDESKRSKEKNSSHLKHEAVLPREHGPDEDGVENLVVLFGLGRADVGQLPLEVC